MAADRHADEVESAEALREVVLSQRRELDALRRETADVALLLDALDALLQVGSDEDPFAAVFTIVCPVFRFSDALVLVERDDPGSPLTCIVATQPAAIDAECAPSRFFEKVLAGRVTARIAIDDSDPEAAAFLPLRQPALYLPLRVRKRRGMVVLLRDRDSEGFDRRDIRLAGKFSLLASHALAARSANRSERERKRLHHLTEELEAAQATLAHRANHDVLTGLPNRRYFEERVVRALDGAAGRPLALAFIDLDGFKQVNDRHGHNIGDGLLAAAAERVVRHIRSTDVLARISGDEFILLIDPIDGEQAVDTVIERILTALKEPFDVEGIRILVSASVGIAIHPDDGRGYDELRRSADLAMYSAKTRAKGTAAYFDASLGRAAAQRAAAEQVVRRALAERRFRVVLQPLVRLDSMEIAGFEVLARREDEAGRLHQPAGFISLAADLGLLDAVTHMLVDEVMEAMPALDERFGTDVTLSLNVSAHQASDLPGMRRLLARLSESGSADRFVVEVTEDAYLHAGVFKRDVLPLLRHCGVRVSIDDFGTGYASFATLLDLSADELKIDRVFITDAQRRPRSQVILSGIATAAEALGIDIVAEGVETEGELAHLLSLPAIGRAQGYLFARPAPVDELLATAPELLAHLRSLHLATASITAASITAAVG